MGAQFKQGGSYMQYITNFAFLLGITALVYYAPYIIYYLNN